MRAQIRCDDVPNPRLANCPDYGIVEAALIILHHSHIRHALRNDIRHAARNIRLRSVFCGKHLFGLGSERREDPSTEGNSGVVTPFSRPKTRTREVQTMRAIYALRSLHPKRRTRNNAGGAKTYCRTPSRAGWRPNSMRHAAAAAGGHSPPDVVMLSPHAPDMVPLMGGPN